MTRFLERFECLLSHSVDKKGQANHGVGFGFKPLVDIIDHKCILLKILKIITIIFAFKIHIIQMARLHTFGQCCLAYYF